MPDYKWSDTGVFVPQGWATPDDILVGLDSTPANAQFTPQAGYKYIVADYATTANLTTTYDNGTAGVGATLTATSNGAISVDGGSPSLNQILLVKDQSTTFQNGVYSVTQVGDGSNPFILTRITGFDESFEIPVNIKVKVISGTVNANSNWQQTATVATIGTDAITFGLDGLLDEDAMVSNSATKGATQQSIVSYVNSQIGSTITDWVAYTPTFTGFGTVSGVEIWSRRVGNTLEIRGRFTSGTSTAVTAQMTLGFNGVNSAVSSSSTKITTRQFAGSGAVSYTVAQQTTVLVDSGVGYVNFGAAVTGRSGMAPINGSTLLSSGDYMSFCAFVPVDTWP